MCVYTGDGYNFTLLSENAFQKYIENTLLLYISSRDWHRL